MGNNILTRAGTVILSFDGGCGPTNPGGYGTWGWVLTDHDGEFIDQACGCLGRSIAMTNNIAEYAGLSRGLRAVGQMVRNGDLSFGIDRLLVRGDSELIIRQVKGKWKCKAQHLISLRDECVNHIRGLQNQGIFVELVWVSREENTTADELTAQAYESAILQKS